jgi:hypothetical protein
MVWWNQGPELERAQPIINSCFSCVYNFLWNRGSSVSIVSDYGVEVLIPSKDERIFALASVSRPPLRPTQPSIQWIPRILSLGVKCIQGKTLTPHPHLVQRSRMSRSYTSSLPKRLRGVQWNSFTFLIFCFYLPICFFFLSL